MNIKTISLRQEGRLKLIFEEAQTLTGMKKSALIVRAIDLTSDRITKKETILWDEYNRKFSNEQLNEISVNRDNTWKYNVDYDQLLNIINNLKDHFHVTRLSTNFAIRLILTFYISEYTKHYHDNLVEKTAEETLKNLFSISKLPLDAISFKIAYQTHDNPTNRQLCYNFAKELLRNKPEIDYKLQLEVKEAYKKFSSFFECNEFKINIRVRAAIISGIIIVLSDSFMESIELYEVIPHMERKLKNENN